MCVRICVRVRLCVHVTHCVFVYVCVCSCTRVCVYVCVCVIVIVKEKEIRESTWARHFYIVPCAPSARPPWHLERPCVHP